MTSKLIKILQSNPAILSIFGSFFIFGQINLLVCSKSLKTTKFDSTRKWKRLLIIWVSEGSLQKPKNIKFSIFSEKLTFSAEIGFFSCQYCLKTSRWNRPEKVIAKELRALRGHWQKLWSKNKKFPLRPKCRFFLYF